MAEYEIESSPFLDRRSASGASKLEEREAVNAGGQLSPAALFEWLNQGDETASGERITSENALKLLTVYACVRVIAESVASLPLKLFERTSDGHQEAIDQNLWYLLSAEANPEMSAYTWIESMIGTLALLGNSYSQIERGKNNQVVAIWPLHPHKTEPMRDPATKKLFYRTSDGMPFNQTRDVAATDILHLKLFSYDGLKGLSPVEHCRQTLGLNMAQEKFAAKFFGNGAIPSGLLLNKNKLDPKAQVEVRESWAKQQGGTNQGKIGFLFGTEWDYKQISLPNEASQFIQSKAVSRADMSQGMFRVPSHMIGSETKLPGSGAEQLALQFATYCLQPYLTNFEQEVVRKLLPNVGRKANKFFVQFAVDAILRTDFATQQAGFQAGIIGGWLCPDDVRVKLGMNAKGGALSVYRAPVNYQNADRLLDTESIQDQPVNTKPEPDPDAPPTQAERNMLGVYTRTYCSLYADAFKRLSKRNKRDFPTVYALFQPVLRCIADMASGGNGTSVDTSNDEFEGVITDALKAMVKRSAKWPEVIPEGDMANIANAEFTKAVRSIHIAVLRDAAAAKAVKQLEVPEESDAETVQS